MATMARYCKAYPLGRLRAYGGWRERDGAGARSDDDIVYVQETYTVTAGIFADEEVIFDAVTPEWREFCRTELAFEIPTDL